MAGAKMPPWKARQAVESVALVREGPASALGGSHGRHGDGDPSGKPPLFKVDKCPGAPAGAAPAGS